MYCTFLFLFYNGMPHEDNQDKCMNMSYFGHLLLVYVRNIDLKLLDDIALSMARF